MLLLALGVAQPGQGSRRRGGCAQLGRQQRSSGGAATRSSSATSGSAGARSSRSSLGVSLASAFVVAALVWIASGATARVRRRSRGTRSISSRWTQPSVAFHDELDWLPLAVGAFGLAVDRRRPGSVLPAAAAAAASARRARRARRSYELVRAHGSDTLAFFKLRRDMHYLFSRRRARVPRLPRRGARPARRRRPGRARPMRFPALIRDACVFAEVRGLEGRGARRERSAAALSGGRPASVRSTSATRRSSRRRASRSRGGRSARSGSRSTGSSRPATPHTPTSWRRSTKRRSPSSSASPSSGARGAAERGFSMAMDSLAGRAPGRQRRRVGARRAGCGARVSALRAHPSAGRRCRSRSCAASGTRRTA